MKDLFVAMPCYDRPCRSTHHSIVNLMCSLTSAGIPATHDSVSCCNVPVARNKLIKKFLETQHTRLLFVDADNTFTPYDLMKLADTLDRRPDVGLIGGNYCKVDGTDVPLCSPKLSISADELIEWMRRHKEKAVDAVAIPTGFMLVRRDVFEKMPPPWFELEHKPNSIDVVTSDYVFCRKVRELGYRTLAHLGVKCGHIGEVERGLVDP